MFFFIAVQKQTFFDNILSQQIGDHCLSFFSVLFIEDFYIFLSVELTGLILISFILIIHVLDCKIYCGIQSKFYERNTNADGFGHIFWQLNEQPLQKLKIYMILCRLEKL